MGGTVSGRRITLLALIGFIPIAIALWVAGFDINQQIGRYVLAAGVVAGEEAIVSAPADGQVSDVRVAVSQSVQAGQTLFRLIGPGGASVDVTAPRGGSAIQVGAVVGQTVRSGDQLAVIEFAPTLHAIAYVDETSISAVQTGKQAEVTVDALGTTYQGTVRQVLPAGSVVEVPGVSTPTITSGRVTYPVWIDFNYGTAPVKLAMTVSVKIYR